MQLKGHLQFCLPVTVPALVLLAGVLIRAVFAEPSSLTPDRAAPEGSSSRSRFTDDFILNVAALSKGYLNSRMDLPRRPRVSRSRHPLRQVMLAGGDHFVAECLDWKSDVAVFRLLTGQVVRVPSPAVASIANPAGEVDVIVESFDAASKKKTNDVPGSMLDESFAAGGRSSLKIDARSAGYRQVLDRSLDSVRIEFSFRAAANDPLTPCGEWQLEWPASGVQRFPLIIRVGGDRSISVSGVIPGTDSMTQTLKMSEGWHTFVGLVSTDRIRLFVDDAVLVSCPGSGMPLSSINFRPVDSKSKNILWIDELQVRSRKPFEDRRTTRDESIDQDVITTANNDELFGRITRVTEASVTFEEFDQQHSIPWARVSQLSWHQPRESIRQSNEPENGVVSRIEMQPFVDRPECNSERWTVTITNSDSIKMIAQHWLLGELTLYWSDISRVDPLFFGQTLMVDARHFHPGNSIRSDFHRHLPDGTELRGDFAVNHTPSRRIYLSLDVAELEAASPDAPPASPFLSQLRAGKLVTEVRINDRSIGQLNPLIRFKAQVQAPDRIRVTIPQELLKSGRNTFRILQHPLKDDGQEYDDCEIGVIRLEFEN